MLFVVPALCPSCVRDVDVKPQPMQEMLGLCELLSGSCLLIHLFILARNLQCVLPGSVLDPEKPNQQERAFCLVKANPLWFEFCLRRGPAAQMSPTPCTVTELLCQTSIT